MNNKLLTISVLLWYITPHNKITAEQTSKPVDEWNNNASFIAFCQLIASLSTVIDAAERAVKFASDFNGSVMREPKKACCYASRN